MVIHELQGEQKVWKSYFKLSRWWQGRADSCSTFYSTYTKVAVRQMAYKTSQSAATHCTGFAAICSCMAHRELQVAL